MLITLALPVYVITSVKKEKTGSPLKRTYKFGSLLTGKCESIFQLLKLEMS
jgi:hypothetical protein